MTSKSASHSPFCSATGRGNTSSRRPPYEPIGRSRARIFGCGRGQRRSWSEVTAIFLHGINQNRLVEGSHQKKGKRRIFGPCLDHTRPNLALASPDLWWRPPREIPEVKNRLGISSKSASQTMHPPRGINRRFFHRAQATRAGKDARSRGCVEEDHRAGVENGLGVSSKPALSFQILSLHSTTL